MQPYIAAPLIFIVGLRAYINKSLTPLGILAAVITATIHAIHPWPIFFVLLLVFFLTGTATTKVKHDVKARLTLSSTGSTGGETGRTHTQVFANSLSASVLILLHFWQLQIGKAAVSCWQYGGSDIVVVGIVCNYAAVAADTFSSELGILSRNKPLLITSFPFRQVPPGTNGGVTLTGTLAGLLGAFVIAGTSLLLLPFCRIGTTIFSEKLVGGHNPGFEGGSGWGFKEKAAWVVAITLWGGLGSLVDSLLGGWLQASVVDTRTGKVVEGSGGGKVPVVAPYSKKSDSSNSRTILSGLGLLDNNGVNLLMAAIMSVGGMAVANYIWEAPLKI